MEDGATERTWRVGEHRRIARREDKAKRRDEKGVSGGWLHEVVRRNQTPKRIRGDQVMFWGETDEG